MASLIKDWLARADWETRMFVLVALRLPLIASVARDEAALLCRGEACLLARTLDAFWMVRETPRIFGCAYRQMQSLCSSMAPIGSCVRG